MKVPRVSSLHKLFPVYEIRQGEYAGICEFVIIQIMRY